MDRLLQDAIQRRMNGTGRRAELAQLNGSYLRDSTTISLPVALKEIWPGVGGSAGETAAIKLQVRLEYLSGQVAGPELQPGRSHDQTSPFHSEELPPGALRLGDLGYFDLDQFEQASDKGVFWLSRYKTNTKLYAENGQKIALLPGLRALTQAQIDIPIQLGAKHFPCRLLAQRVPQEGADQRRPRIKKYARKKQVAPSALLLALADWTLLLTNLPASQFSLPELLILLKVRWQIELLFKAWKNLFKLDEWRSANPWRILTELYAKLLAGVIFHWLTLLKGYPAPQRSTWKASLIFKRFALALALTCDAESVFSKVGVRFIQVIEKAARLNTRSTDPGTIQELLKCTTLA